MDGFYSSKVSGGNKETIEGQLEISVTNYTNGSSQQNGRR